MMLSRFTTTLANRRNRTRATKEYKQLLQVEDHILQDVGLSRFDIKRAMREL